MKLVYKDTGVSVKRNDVINTIHLGQVFVKSVYSPRKKKGSGKIKLILVDGRIADYTPSDIGANWI